MTCLSILRLLPTYRGAERHRHDRTRRHGPAGAVRGRDGRDWRGRRISMVSQDPLTSLNPVFTVGDQVGAPFRYHAAGPGTGGRCGWRWSRCCGACASRRRRRGSTISRISSRAACASACCSAMAIACEPRLLIADEPTSNLDVTIQVQMMDLFREIQRETGVGIILITHDLGVAAGICHRIAVMYAGRVVETGDVRAIYRRPAHPYTRALLDAIPHLGRRRRRLYPIAGQPPSLIDPPEGCRFAARCPARMPRCREAYRREVELSPRPHAACWLPLEAGLSDAARSPGPHQALPHSRRPLRPHGTVARRRGHQLPIPAGETFALVGESGCGKTTIAKMILLLEKPTAGTIRFDGQDIARGSRAAAARRTGAAPGGVPGSLRVAQPAAARAHDHRRAVARAWEGDAARSRNGASPRCSTSSACRRRPPISIRTSSPAGNASASRSPARWRSIRGFMVLDEPISALDVSIRAQILNLLADIQEEFALTYLIIAHDLALVEHFSTRVGVMYLGVMVEMGPTEQVFAQAGSSLHPRVAGLGAAARSGPRRAGGRDQRRDRQRARTSCGLQISSALPDGVRALPSRAAARIRSDAGSPAAVPPAEDLTA